jgi:electron transport complex protein RnfB
MMGEKVPLNRRDFMRGVAAVAVVGATWKATGAKPGETVWQLDPEKCVKCGRCATHCVLNPSAVKCVNSFDICGYCDLCGGYLTVGAKKRDTAAEHQICPTAAIDRIFIEDPYYSYEINESRCIGCAVCVEACEVFGNASFYLQIKQDICINCNECSIAEACPSEAFYRVSERNSYKLKSHATEVEKMVDKV